jgi:hypothetical protein
MARKDITDLQVCQAVAAFWKGHDQGLDQNPCTAARLMAITCQPEKVCYSAVQRAIHHGYLQPGVSLRTAYLSAAGRALLAEESAHKP